MKPQTSPVPRAYPSAPILGVGAIVVHEGKVVVIRRANEPLKGEWSIPGGKVELGETVAQAVVREVREETGLQVEPAALVEVFERITRDEAGKTKYHYVLLDYLCHVRGGELHSGGDASEARWLAATELEAFPIRDFTRAVIRKAMQL